MSFLALPVMPAAAALSSVVTVSTPYVAIGAFLVALIATAIALLAHRRMKRLTLRRGDSLEDTIGELTRRAREMQTFREEMAEYLRLVESRVQKSPFGLGIVRFNPFHGEGTGGNQSFAVAFTDEHGDGVVFSAIYARAGHTSVYAKPIEKGTSTFELTHEEQDAIRQAKERVAAARAPQKKEEKQKRAA